MKRMVTMVLVPVALAFSVMSWAQEKADDWSVLVEAIANGNAGALREAIRAGRDLNARDRQTGQTPLHIAVAYAGAKGDATSVEILLEAGADANAVNSAGGTPLSYADKLNDLKIVRLLLRHGAKTDIPITQAGQTVLHSAAHAGHAEIVRLLLDAKATVDVKSKSGQTPLFFAIAGSHVDAASCLLGAGANPNIKDMSRLTPLFYAANNGKLPIVKTLIDAGADPEARDPEGRTPADWATKKGHKGVADYLLAAPKSVASAIRARSSPSTLPEPRSPSAARPSLPQATAVCDLSRFSLAIDKAEVEPKGVITGYFGNEAKSGEGERLIIVTIRGTVPAPCEITMGPDSELR